MTPFYLITGFLGSGKTTLLKDVIKQADKSCKIAVIQNEFAPKGVDGTELLRANSGLKIVEHNNGSVFCVCLLGNFIKSLEELLDSYKPDMILLEASGLSDPINIAELLHAKSLQGRLSLNHIFTVVDVNTFDKAVNMIGRVKHQVRVADTIILNKMDLFSGDIDSIKETIKKLNPFAKTVSAVKCEFDKERLIGDSAIGGLNAIKAAAGERDDPGGRPSIKALAFRTTKKISEAGLRLFIGELSVKSYRVKGYVNLDDGRVIALQTSFSQIDQVEIFEYVGSTELVVFSEVIDIEEIKLLYNRNIY